MFILILITILTLSSAIDDIRQGYRVRGLENFINDEMYSGNVNFKSEINEDFGKYFFFLAKKHPDTKTTSSSSSSGSTNDLVIWLNGGPDVVH